MKVLYCVNIPSPYRVDFFNELGKYCELTVCFERNTSSERDSKWVASAAKHYKAVNLKLRPFSYDRTISFGLLNYVRKSDADIIVLANYYSPSAMLAISYCRLTGKKFYMEGDGGFFEYDSFPKKLLKKWLILGSTGYFTTCDESIKYLKHLGYREDRIYKYPFSSIKEAEIVSTSQLTSSFRSNKRSQLGMYEKIIVIAVGQFVPRKGFDFLIDAFARLKVQNAGLYIIGGTPTQEYIDQVSALKLNNVHFVGFKTKVELYEYYKAADVVAFPTNEDIWGLITNEAMAHGKPVVATNKCGSALEMIKEGENGYIVPIKNYDTLAKAIDKVLNDGCEKYSDACIETARRYTIETMVDAHLKVWGIKQ